MLMFTQFCYMLLSRHPDVVQQLREEHTKVFAASFQETLSILHDNPHKLNELSYTTAVIRETLRLFPIGFGVKAAAPDAMLTSKKEGQSFPIGHNLAVVPLWHHMHYNPSYFEDPASFKPERFLDPELVTRGSMRTFSRGPRGCAGQELALQELCIILLMTIRDFEFEYVSGAPNGKARVTYTDLDKTFGAVVFQELGMEAKPRSGMTMFKVRKVD